MIGTVTRGINNIFTVLGPDGICYMCRIKGKQLFDITGEYNVLAVGDEVEFTPTGTEEGQITARLERRNCFQRWNVKGQCNQTVVANMDLIVCVCSVDTPPFRPRFIDRVITCSRGCDVLICLNKCDISLTEDEFERFRLYHELGYRTIAVSAQTGENVDELVALIRGKKVAFVGQSGVGKSTLVNRIMEGAASQRTGEVSAKYNRGRHTTNYSLMMFRDDLTIVDTPGVREIMVPHRDRMEIADSFPEFVAVKGKCEYDECLHDSEPGCMVKKLVEEGKIHMDRYESYLRMLASVDEQNPAWKGSTNSTSRARYKVKKVK